MQNHHSTGHPSLQTITSAGHVKDPGLASALLVVIEGEHISATCGVQMTTTSSVLDQALYPALRAISLALSVPETSEQARHVLEWARKRAIRAIDEVTSNSNLWESLAGSPDDPAQSQPNAVGYEDYSQLADSVAKVVLDTLPQHAATFSTLVADLELLAGSQEPRKLLSARLVSAATQAGLLRLRNDFEQLTLRIPAGGASAGPIPRQSRLRNHLASGGFGLAIFAASIQGQPVMATVGLNLFSQGVWEVGEKIFTSDDSQRPGMAFTAEDQAELRRLKELLDEGAISREQYEKAKMRAAPIFVSGE